MEKVNELGSYVLTTDDDLPRPIEVLSSDGWKPGAEQLPVRIAPASDDTSGQILAGATTIDVVVFGDDTEGHALSLRFPSPQEAAAFQKRLLLTGALAGTLVAGSLAASTAMTQVANQSGPQAAPAPAQQVGTVVGRPGNVTPEISRIGDSGSLTSEYAASHSGDAAADEASSNTGDVLARGPETRRR